MAQDPNYHEGGSRVTTWIECCYIPIAKCGIEDYHTDDDSVRCLWYIDTHPPTRSTQSDTHLTRGKSGYMPEKDIPTMTAPESKIVRRPHRSTRYHLQRIEFKSN